MKFERTEAGLIVPEGVKPKAQRAMLADDFKKIVRAIRHARGEGIMLAPACQKCSSPVSMAVGGQIKAALGGGRVVALECECTRWAVRRDGRGE